MKAQREVHTASNNRPAFTNDLDHSSEPSREGSVQIVDSHRHTFSVPSSDDEFDSEDEEEEAQIASSVQGDDEEVSAATTPDRQPVGKAHKTEVETRGPKTGLAPCERRGLNLKGPRLQDLLTKTATDGTSQETPINLESASTNIIDVDTESEDDGPDVLPFYESSQSDQPSRPRVWNEPQVARQTSTVTMPTMVTVAERPSDRDSEIQRNRIVPETQTKVAKEDEAKGDEPRSNLTRTLSGVTDGFDTEDDDAFDYDHEFFADEDLEPFPEPPVSNVGASNTPKPRVTFQVGGERPYSSTLTPPFDEFRPTRLGHLSVSDAIDVSQPTEPSSVWVQRAPSPSDAALARKASDPKTCLGRDIFDNYPVPQWPAATKSTLSKEHVLDNAARQEHIGAFSWPELQSPEPHSYDQGPFSSQPKDEVLTSRSPKPANFQNQPKKATVTWAGAHQGSHDMIMNTDRFSRAGKRASKITIPSLVENYLAENPRSLKRKYGETNGNNDVEAAPNVPGSGSPATRTSGCKRTFTEVDPVISSESLEEETMGTRLRSEVEPTDFMRHLGEGSTMQHQFGLADQDTPLPDAQPRENMFQTPTTNTSQDSVAEPTLGPVSVTATVQDNGIQGPARKKARTSSSSPRGVGKFVMGVGFGLLGAAAAFIATIPASVYDEALRELGNAA